MKKRVSSSESKRILGKVPSQVSFWLCTNEQLRSLDELSISLKRANDDVFRYHVNRDKNDFEAWIRETIRDKELAREISRIKTRATLIRKLDERVAELRKTIQQSAPKRIKKKAARKQKKRGKNAKRKKPKKAKKTKKIFKMGKQKKRHKKKHEKS